MGMFRDSYEDLIRDTVIPGSETKRISAAATLPAAAVEAPMRNSNSQMCRGNCVFGLV
jgi:hypothetical protein